MKEHGGLLVANCPDTLFGRIKVTGAALKLLKCDRIFITDVVLVFDELFLAEGDVSCLVGLIRVVGKVGCKPFRPVARPFCNPDTVAEPGVQDFVAERGVLNKRQPKYDLTEQGKGRHGIAGWKPVLNNAEAGVRIGAEQRFVTGEIAKGFFTVGSGKALVFAEKIGIQGLAIPERDLFHDIRAGNKIQGMGRVGEVKADILSFLILCGNDLFRLGYRLKMGRNLCRELKKGVPVENRMPESG